MHFTGTDLESKQKKVLVSGIRKYSGGRIVIDLAGVIRIDFIGRIRIDSFDKIGNYLCLFYDFKEGTRKI